MNNDKIVGLKKPEEFEDELTALLRGGARQLLAEAIEAEVEDFLEAFQDYKDSRGHRHVVRNGYLPEREVQTGIGSISVKVPKTRDRSGSGLKFQSQLLPPYLRRSKSMEDVIPWLYLKGISTGDFQEALAALVGPDAKGLSAGTVSRLKSKWQQEHKQWAGRSLESKRYVYFWADGIYFNIRADEARQCILVIIGVTEQGRKEFVAIEDGYRESEQSWRELLLSLKNRGLLVAPKLAVGDGALGFWKALSKVYGQTRHQRCWVHKTANILNNLPKTQQLKAKSNLHEIWMAATREDAHKAFDHFISTYQSKYPKASECLEKDRDALLAFYDFPAEHWQHIRTTNPIESTFATVRLRSVKTRGCVSRVSILSLVYKLGTSAQKRWQRLRGFKLLADVIQGVKFTNGEKDKSGRVAA
uniref:Mutator family transposase n=1 Tax=Magnetococcus massalia (strain MO-1) TaxID=451514 RepID=A0A1S7LM65_MAGMO|nr:Transposase [Candidatus Magnetococcus massalia]